MRDLDLSDFAEIRRRALIPVASRLLRPEELLGIEVKLVPERAPGPDDPPDCIMAWTDTPNEIFAFWVGTPDPVLVEAEPIADRFYDQLQDFIAESSFGWGTLREGTYAVPPNPLAHRLADLARPFDPAVDTGDDVAALVRLGLGASQEIARGALNWLAAGAPCSPGATEELLALIDDGECPPDLSRLAEEYLLASGLV